MIVTVENFRKKLLFTIKISQFGFFTDNVEWIFTSPLKIVLNLNQNNWTTLWINWWNKHFAGSDAYADTKDQLVAINEISLLNVHGDYLR